MYQKYIAIGRNVKEIQLKYSKDNNTPIANFTIAINNSYNDKAEFVNCVCFKNKAEVVAKYVKKGSLINIEGRLQTRDYMDKDNQKRYITEVVCDSVTFLDSKKTDQEQPKDELPKSNMNDVESNLPF